MKKIALLITALSCGCIFISSCNDDECDVLIDPVKTPVCFIVKDNKGNNLLDPNFEGNILSEDIEVTYKNQQYPLVLSEYDSNSSERMGLHIGAVGSDNTPGILFWYFYIGRDTGGDVFTISWGDGNTDTIKFDFYYTVVKCEPEYHKKIYLNDVVNSENSLTVSIIK